MQVRKVKSIVNALDSQERLIYHLVECPHNISISAREIARSGRSLEYYLTATEATCVRCPDLPPPTERESKSATQLWKEAGEP